MSGMQRLTEEEWGKYIRGQANSREDHVIADCLGQLSEALERGQTPAYVIALLNLIEAKYIKLLTAFPTAIMTKVELKARLAALKDVGLAIEHAVPEQLRERINYGRTRTATG